MEIKERLENKKIIINKRVDRVEDFYIFDINLNFFISSLYYAVIISLSTS